MLITIEGPDGSGKATQTKLLASRLEQSGYKVQALSFPCYGSDSSFMVKKYLEGEFGIDASPYVASLCYAQDRAIQMKTVVSKIDSDTILISDRYVGSNMMYQGSRVKTEQEGIEYLQWVQDLEYSRFGIPKPDCTLFLNVPASVTFEKVKARTDNDVQLKRDIHEESYDIQFNAYSFGLLCCKLFDWKIIDCIREGGMMPVDELSDILLEFVINLLNKTAAKVAV